MQIALGSHSDFQLNFLTFLGDNIILRWTDLLTFLRTQLLSIFKAQ